MRGAFVYTLICLAPAAVFGQLSGSVGPLVDFETKAKNKTCDITDYGAVADGETDVGQAILDAWGDCAVGGRVYIPPGEYSLATDLKTQTWRVPRHSADSVLMRGHEGSYQMILIRGCSDFELFSGNSQGAIQGFGYEYISPGRRIYYTGNDLYESRK